MRHYKVALIGFISMNLLLLTAVAQFDLARLSTRTVKQNQPWGSINTAINHLAVNITVNKGVVTTDIEVTLTPDSAIIHKRNVGINGVIEKKSGYAMAHVDSLETTANFYLPANTAITDLHLWVGEEKVRGYLQERALASAQYESIVKRRRDPLLVETWGNGNYSLRLFPLESEQTRKFQLQFVQGMENNTDGVYTVLPLAFYRQYLARNPMLAYEERKFRTIDKLTVTVKSADGKNYALNWEGLGNLVVSATPQTVTQENITELKTGKLMDPDKAAALKAWTGIKNSKAYFGVKSTLIYKDLVVEKEPLERIFILDVPDNQKNLERAKKLALLALKSYVQKDQIFNLGFADQKGTLSFLFNGSLPMTKVNLAKAYEGLINWTGSAKGHSLSILEKYAAGNAVDDDVIVLLISGQPYKEYPVPHPGKSGNPDMDRQLWESWNSAYTAWRESEEKRAQALIETFKAKKLMLFGFWHDYKLRQVANATGGYQLGTLGGNYYWYRPYPVYYDAVTTNVIGGAPIAPPPEDKWYMPPLFGPGRPGSSGPQNIEVTTSGITATDLAVLTDSRYYPYHIMRGVEPGIMVDDAPILAKTASKIAPDYYNNRDSVGVRVSGIYLTPGILTINISGTWNGLAFSKTERLNLAPSPAGSPLAASLWAYQKSEDLRISDYKGSIEAVKALGKEHHVINSQMSLLALEPGMELWKELPNPEGANNAQRGADQVFASVDGAAAPTVNGKGNDTGSSQTGNLNLDNITLEEILKAATGLLEELPSFGKHPVSLAIRVDAAVQLTVSGLSGSETVSIQIRNISGKIVARLNGEYKGETYHAAWTPEKSSNGIYMAIVGVNNKKLVKRIVLSK